MANRNNVGYYIFFLLSKFTEGPIECETVYETECATTYHLHEVEEDSPNCKIQMVSCLWIAYLYGWGT